MPNINFDGTVYRGSIEVEDGATIYAGERLYVEYMYCDEGESFKIKVTDGENTIQVTDSNNDSYDEFVFDYDITYCFVNDVSSNIYIEVVPFL